MPDERVGSPMQQQFKELERVVFADGALPAKTKELIAFAAAHVTQSERCIHGHRWRALVLGATEQELIEAMWVATVMRAAGGIGGGLRAEADIAATAERYRQKLRSELPS